MTHCQIFYPFDNEDGFISVVCHRERFLENLLSLGWQKTAADAIAVRDELKEKDEKPVVNESLITEKEPEQEGDQAEDVVPMSIAGLSTGQRKKLSLKK